MYNLDNALYNSLLQWPAHTKAAFYIFMTLPKGISQQPKFWWIPKVLRYNSFLLISECFTIHYVLISSNRSKHLYSFPVCKTVLLANAKQRFYLSFHGLWLLSRLSRFGFYKNKWKSYQFPLDPLIGCNIFSAILHQIQQWFFMLLWFESWYFKHSYANSDTILSEL